MDLFTCGGGKLIPILPLIKKLFGVKAEGEDSEEPSMLWSHKLRGFRDGFVPGYDSSRNPLDSDLGRYITGRLDHDIKMPVLSARTDFQTVDVYELMDPTTRNANDFHKSLEDDDSYESLHPENFGPNRVLLLDGVIQSTLYGDAPYHESIVHPAMITHPNPKRVAIIGGGEGATLREVLKHSTVEQAVMIEIDEGVVSLSKDYLPEWQDCSSIAHHEGRAAWCFNDTRADARFEDAMGYFIDNFAPNRDDNDDDESPYEVIVMDCLDPNDSVEFAELLYTSDTYIQSLHDALTDDGILVVQVGQSPTVKWPADEMGAFAKRSEMMKKLDEIGFESIHIYEESHAGFLAPWSIIVAFKDVTTRERWYRSSAEIELDLSRRILPTKEGKTSLRYFDGATMRSYQVPGKNFETVYCRQGEQPQECNDKSHHEMNAIITSSAYNPLLERHATHKPIQSVVALKSARNGKAPLQYTEGVAPGLSLTMDLNSILFTSISEFQEVQIIDTYFGKTLVTDGKTQSSEHDESVYHESLVHPAMFWSAYLNGSRGSSPKSVFIGGGGELATAREVLKHTSVERVVMVDIDGVVVQSSKKYLPEWGGDAVLNHAKMEYIVGDIFQYFKETQEQFDVIIIDVSDPIEAGPATALYTKEFYMQVQKLLKIHGVFITQAGSADFVPHLHSSLAEADSDETTCFSPIRNTLAAVFDHAIPYSCPVASFGEDWGFVIAFNGDKSLARTLVDLPSEEIDQMIDERIEAVPGVPEHRARSVGVKQVLPGSKGGFALVHYDGVLHRRLFALSKPLREMMRMDDRIMTLDNPIYMY
jgi:thermospermine synthase